MLEKAKALRYFCQCFLIHQHFSELTWLHQEVLETLQVVESPGIPGKPLNFQQVFQLHIPELGKIINYQKHIRNLFNTLIAAFFSRILTLSEKQPSTVEDGEILLTGGSTMN